MSGIATRGICAATVRERRGMRRGGGVRGRGTAGGARGAMLRLRRAAAVARAAALPPRLPLRALPAYVYYH
jgi:hypothetical protein